MRLSKWLLELLFRPKESSRNNKMVVLMSGWKAGLHYTSRTTGQQFSLFNGASTKIWKLQHYHIIYTNIVTENKDVATSTGWTLRTTQPGCKQMCPLGAGSLEDLAGRTTADTLVMQGSGFGISTSPVTQGW